MQNDLLLITIYIITILLLIYKFKFAFPVTLGICLFFREEFEVTFNLYIGGFNIYFIELCIITSFLVSIYYLRRIRLSNNSQLFVKILMYLYISYLFFIIYSSVFLSMTFKEAGLSSRVFIPELAVMPAFIYSIMYGYKRLIFWIGIIFAIIVIQTIYITIVITNYLHNAFLGLTASYLLLFCVYLFLSKKNKIISYIFLAVAIVALVLPFVGSVRGGMISVVISILLVIYYFTFQKKQSFYLPFVLFSIFIIVYILFQNFQTDYFVVHQGNNTLSDLINFSLSNKADALNGRNMLWEVIGDSFLENPIFGVGYFTPFKVWGFNTTALIAHNYFIYKLAAGGLVQFIFIFVLYYYIIKNIFKSNKKDFMSVFAINCILTVININFSNVHFANFGPGFMIWTILGCSVAILSNSNPDMTFNFRVRKNI